MDPRQEPRRWEHCFDGSIFTIVEVTEGKWSVSDGDAILGHLTRLTPGSDGVEAFSIRLSDQGEPEVDPEERLDDAVDHLIELAAWRRGYPDEG